MNNEALRRLALFADLSDADLDWLSSHAEPLTIAAGAPLIREGEPGDSAFVVLDGEFEVVKKAERQDIVVAVREAGEVFGEMALIDQAPRNATVRAVRESSVLRISEDTFKQLLGQSPSASLAILQTVSRRLRQNEGLVRQNEKMAALGTLAAGLAHELNNPAAAVRRSANQLMTALADWVTEMTALPSLSMDAGQLQALEGLRARIEDHRTPASAPDALVQSDLTDEMQAWLEQRNIPNAWQFTPVLVSNGWDVRAVSDLETRFPAAALGPILRWLAAGLSVYSLLDDVKVGMERVSEIVKAVKAYSYLDQAPIQNVDVHEGLDNTLVILKHKLTGIEIVREYDPDLPHIEAHGSELNQAWTNIIDNAAYAMGGSGRLKLRTAAQDGQVEIDIQDSGPGIPPEIQQRIFEPFFTTKPPGIGTGLGLHIAYNIVNNHYGRIQLTSQPGDTCFQITLPVQLPH
ncbi:MAG TPA: ATP-binding protein [Anaerolineales bacterium]|nr:ATP-binding protein [Anaerolineales bacterium]